MKHLLKAFEFTIIFLYLFIGCILLFTANFSTLFAPFLKQAFGVILILYGIFRGYQFYRKYFITKENENN